MSPTIEEVLALDLLCLQAPDGGAPDPVSHRAALEMSVPRSQWALVRRNDRLIAYGYLWPIDEGSWFVGGLAIHPEFRRAPTILALGTAFAGLVRDLGVQRLESHVRRNNHESLRLHRRLGFTVERENERAIAFAADAPALLAKLPV